jgi:hypothetical protein
MELEHFITHLFAQNNPYLTGDNTSITDEVFLLIQNTPDLMHRYQRLIESEGLNKVNSTIGRAVKEHYNLTNDDSRKNNPNSTLIRSHQIFEN